MSWRVAKSLNKLLEQINAAAPGRSKRSDGSIGDAAHSSRTSDHNPDSRGIVHARDFTHDPKGGFDAHAFADRLRLAGDRRVKYIISNSRIHNPSIDGRGGGWRPYRGSNPHSQHVHVSCVYSSLEDDTSDWPGIGPVGPAEVGYGDLLKIGTAGEPVKDVQAVLGIVADGVFGPSTEVAVKTFQRKQGLDADGIVGPTTWEALKNHSEGILGMTTIINDHFAGEQTIQPGEEIHLRVTREGKHVVAPAKQRGQSTLATVRVEVHDLPEGHELTLTPVIRDWRTGDVAWRWDDPDMIIRGATNQWPVTGEVTFADELGAAGDDREYQILARNTSNTPVKITKAAAAGAHS